MCPENSHNERFYCLKNAVRISLSNKQVTQRRSRDRVYINKGWHHLFTRSETRLSKLQSAPFTHFPNGDGYGKIGVFWGGVLRPVRLLQSARLLVPRRRQRENQERDRAQHEPPLPRRTREEDRREISQQPNEAQENQELVVLISPHDVYR